MMSEAAQPHPAARPSLARAETVRRSAHRLRGGRGPWPSPVVAVCFVALALLALAAVFAPWLAPHNPIAPSLADRNRPPAWMAGGGRDHPLGTDQLGYDLYSRVLYGARVSLGIGLAAALLGTLLGTLLGLLAGYLRGPVDWLVMLAADAQLAIPFVLVAIAAVAAFGPSLVLLVVLAGVSGWVTLARACRAAVLSLRRREFVLAARASGASDARILARHVLPNLGSLVLVIATIDFRGYILLEASLSFLGLGVQPPQPSWGGMVDQGREYLATAWWIGVVPGAALVLTVLAVSLIGDWLRDALDPALAGGLGRRRPTRRCQSRPQADRRDEQTWREVTR